MKSGQFKSNRCIIQFVLIPLYLFMPQQCRALPDASLSGNIDLISGLHFKGRSSPFQIESPFLPSAVFDLDLKGIEPSDVSWSSDALISYRAFGGDYLLNSSKDIDFQQYRMWLRYNKNKVQIRAGKQKMIFGHARYFRPLSFFDDLNPQDSSGITRGEKSFHLKYFPDNNWDLHAWAVYNDAQISRPQPGVRLNRILKNGEMAVTWHQWNHPGSVQENIIGFDAFIDNEASYWLEAANHSPETGDSYYEFTLGTDYTFDVGNGLHVGMEITSENGRANNIESERAALFFDIPVTDFNRLYGSYFYSRFKSAKGFNLRFSRDIAENLYSELYFNWSDISFNDFMLMSPASQIFFENIIALRMRYSF